MINFTKDSLFNGPSLCRELLFRHPTSVRPSRRDESGSLNPTLPIIIARRAFPREAVLLDSKKTNLCPDDIPLWVLARGIQQHFCPEPAPMPLNRASRLQRRKPYHLPPLGNFGVSPQRDEGRNGLSGRSARPEIIHDHASFVQVLRVPIRRVLKRHGPILLVSRRSNVPHANQKIKLFGLWRTTL
jgi:hypothetical protein